MFAVLCVTENKKSVFRKRRCEVEALLSPVKGAAPFKVLNVTPGRRGIDWRAVSVAAGSCSKSMLLPQVTELPFDSGIELFEPHVLPLLISLNTACANLSGASRRSSLLVVDREAVLPDFIERAVLSASKITVVTDCPEKYYPCVADLLERFGVAIRVCDDTDENTCYDAAVTACEKVNAKMVFDAFDTEKMLCNLEIPEACRRMCPQEIDPFLFLCALFECCGWRVAGELTLTLM